MCKGGVLAEQSTNSAGQLSAFFGGEGCSLISGDFTKAWHEFRRKAELEGASKQLKPDCPLSKRHSKSLVFPWHHLAGFSMTLP